MCLGKHVGPYHMAFEYITLELMMTNHLGLLSEIPEVLTDSTIMWCSSRPGPTTIESKVLEDKMSIKS